MHAAIEERVLYPVAIDAAPDLEDRAELAEALDDARRSAPEMPPARAQARARLEQVAERAQELFHRLSGSAAV